MDDQKQNKPTGRVNYVWVMAGGYLLYLAFKLFSGVFTGESDMLVVSILGGAVFVAVGAYLLLREWKSYQYGKAHMNDPESWSEDRAEPTEALEESTDEDMDEPASPSDEEDL